MFDERAVNSWGSISMFKTCFLLVLLSLLGACASSTVVVKGSVPPPLIDALPITASLSYTDEFKSYTYLEAEKKRALKSLDFGAAQVILFDTVFANLLNLVTPDTAIKDLVIEPEILDFQYTAPRETKLKLYEVWIKYRLRITDANNKEVADWVVKGYGKTPTALLTTASAAFNSATNVALRDVGAQLSIGFGKQSDIAALLQRVKSGRVSQTDLQLLPEAASEAAATAAPETDATSIDEENTDENQL